MHCKSSGYIIHSTADYLVIYLCREIALKENNRVDDILKLSLTYKEVISKWVSILLNPNKIVKQILICNVKKYFHMITSIKYIRYIKYIYID